MENKQRFRCEAKFFEVVRIDQRRTRIIEISKDFRLSLDLDERTTTWLAKRLQILASREDSEGFAGKTILGDLELILKLR